MFYLSIRNGQGSMRSNWYVIEEIAASKENAIQRADTWASDNPASEGWRADVALFEDPNHPSYQESDPIYWARPKAYNG